MTKRKLLKNITEIRGNTRRKDSKSISLLVSGLDSAKIVEISSSVRTLLRPFSFAIRGGIFSIVTFPFSPFVERNYGTPSNQKKEESNIKAKMHKRFSLRKRVQRLISKLMRAEGFFKSLTLELRPLSSTWVNWLWSQGSETTTPTKPDIFSPFPLRVSLSIIRSYGRNNTSLEGKSQL